MATILLDRHAATEAPDTSEYTLFSGLERILMTRHTVLRIPPHRSWSQSSLENWIYEHAFQADIFLGVDFHTIKCLRKRGWQGKVILKALGDLPHGASGLRSALPYLYKTDVVWCSSSADKHLYYRLIEQDGTQPEVIVLPYGIDGGVYAPVSPSDKLRLRTAWGISPDDFVIVYANRITVEKNFHSVLDAIHHLLAAGARLKLVVATRFENVPFREFSMWGTGIDAKMYQKIEKLDLKEHITTVPWLDSDRLNQLYNIGDVFVNLTLATGENFGYAQVEAMSAGLPVVATAWGGLKDTVIDEQTGFLCDTWVTDYGIRFDMPRVVNSLRYLMEESILRKELAARAVQHARKYYAWPVYSASLLQLIDRLTRGEGASGTRARLTNFGASFHSRFSIGGESASESSGRAPVFASLSDHDYIQLIEPYTSRGMLDHDLGSELFLALTGSTDGEFFVSHDVLWPVRIRISDREREVVQQLSRFETVDRDRLDCPTDVVYTLVKKGIVGSVRRQKPSRLD